MAKATEDVRTMLPGEGQKDEALLGEVVVAITELHLKAGLAYHLALGQLLLERFFGGDLEAYTKRGKTHESFRALARRDDLPVSHTTLYNAVAVTRQYRLLPEDYASKLTMMHHRALFPLKSDKTRKKLAQQAVDEGLTGERLKELARAEAAKERKGEKRGRPVLPAFEKTINLFDRVLKADGSFDDLDAIEDLETDRAAELYKAVTGLKLKCEELQTALQGKVPGLE